MIKTYLLIATLLITHKTWACEPDFRGRLEIAIKEYSTNVNREKRIQIGQALEWLRNPQNRQAQPSPQVLATLQSFNLASEEGGVYKEVLKLAPKIKIAQFATHPVVYTYYLPTDD